jgi:glycosyltransferase involved in cell wall biosynthesis
MDLDVSVIHASSDFLTACAALTAARMIGVPFVLDHAEQVPEIAQTSVEAQQAERFQLFQSMQRTLAAEADAVLARTAMLRQMLVDGGVSAVAIREVFDGAVASDDRRPKPIAASNPALAGRKVIGFIGEANAEFDLEMLPALLAKVAAAGVDVALHAVGTGSQFERLQHVAKELGVGDRLSLPGRPKLPDIGGHYELIDVVVLPYRSRSWRAPYELVESMAHGTCVICPDFTDITELMGDAGIVVPQEAFGNTEMLASTVIELLTDDERRARLANSAKIRASKHFELEHLGHSLFQVYVQAWKRAGGVVGATSSELSAAD